MYKHPSVYKHPKPSLWLWVLKCNGGQPLLSGSHQEAKGNCMRGGSGWILGRISSLK